jgi:predicted lipoprotein with Yx(FWY)xxD motif
MPVKARLLPKELKAMAVSSRKALLSTRHRTLARLASVGLVVGGLVAPLVAPVAAQAASTRGKVAVDIARRGKYGKILVTGQGFTLYRYSADKPDRSTCTGECAVAWPPLTLPKGVKAAVAGAGVTGLGTISISGGALQVTYHQTPLYLFASDTKPGEVNGQGVGGFFVIHPGAATSTTPTTKASSWA